MPMVKEACMKESNYRIIVNVVKSCFYNSIDYKL